MQCLDGYNSKVLFFLSKLYTIVFFPSVLLESVESFSRGSSGVRGKLSLTQKKRSQGAFFRFKKL